MKKDTEGKFNDSHPELREGEAFLRNIDPNRIPMGNGVEACKGRFELTAVDADGRNPLHDLIADELSLPSIRYGEIAYDNHGNIEPRLKPVFVNAQEYARKYNMFGFPEKRNMYWMDKEGGGREIEIIGMS